MMTKSSPAIEYVKALGFSEEFADLSVQFDLSGLRKGD